MKASLESLTPAQREAVEHVDGPLLILAGPGSGKTRVVTHRVANLLSHGIPARQILALTFTNKAAEEMHSRVARLVPEADVWTSTFHRFCARLLRRYAPLVGLGENFTIYDVEASGKTLKRALDRVDVSLSLHTPEQIAAAISRAKNQLISAERYGRGPATPLGTIVAAVYPAYQAELLNANAVDFDDLLLYVASLVREQPEVRQSLDERFRYILVDEYQDTNLAQYAIVRGLSINYPNLSVTGDPDQSIYGWRGANVSNILEFERDFPGARVVRLEQNYRSTQRILSVASALIAQNKRRKRKELFTDNAPGAPVRYVCHADHTAEAESLAAEIAEAVRNGERRPRDFAVFYRVNALSRAIEFALRSHAVPYQMVNGLEFYQRKEIKDVLAYLHLLNNPRDNVALLRVINTPTRGIGKTTVERLSAHAAQRGISLLEAARESGLIESLPKRAAVAVARFVALYDRLALHLEGPIEDLVGYVLSESGYRQVLEQSEQAEDEDRLANIEELLTAAREFDERHGDDGNLEAFLEQASLVNETDAWEVDNDRVTLMTLHASKGLEFPVVYILALEQGLIPHERSRRVGEELEEERRLLFVGITRAEEELRLSRAYRRSFRGQDKITVPSSFLLELPRDEMDFQEFTAAETVPAYDRAVARLRAATREGHGTAGLTTAAQLADGADGVARMDPEAFYLGMLVEHPEYGVGEIVALGGTGALRRATVAFEPSVGEKPFILAHSKLRPIEGG